MLNLEKYESLSKYRENDTSAGYEDALEECFGVACTAIFDELKFNSGHLIINYQPEESDDRLTKTTDEADESRACFLFKEYQRYINDKKSKDSKFTPYFIHDHFKDQHSLICMSLEKGDPISIKYYKENDVPENSDLDKDKNLNDGASGKHEYKEFVDVMFNVEGKASEFRQRVSTERNSPFAFICFNLSIPYFSYMGSVMFEITMEGFDTSKFIEEMKAKVVHIREALMVVKRIEYDYINKRNLRKIKLEAIRSAIAAIMSRNMSHNLGSHYLYYTKTHLESLAKAQTEISPDIRGAAKVLGYIQARMDYVATVASNDKYPYGAVNFKSQLYDELTIDKFSKRHFLDDNTIGLRTTNYLLTNLIMSEKFTIPNILKSELPSGFNKLDLYVKYHNDETNEYDLFTGTHRKSSMIGPTITKEQGVKERLSGLNIALPGGIMSSHAFFNVVENFIRNSAKYLQADFKQEGLIFNIAIRKTPKKEGFVDLIVYDNKQNANRCLKHGKEEDCLSGYTLYESIIDRLKTLTIIHDATNEIGKDNKGFKEILFSSVWMKSYEYTDSSYADVLTEINNASKGNDKLELIEKYGFALVQVVESGKKQLDIYGRNDCTVENIENRRSANLGISLTLPLYNKTFKFEPKPTKQETNEAMLSVFSDIVGLSETVSEDVRKCFTRVSSNMCDPVEALKKILIDRFPEFEKYKLNFEESCDADVKYILLFKRHLNSQKDISQYSDYAYADTVSGGNFTITIQELIASGLNESGDYKSREDEYFALKVKESALTRITIIDERLYNSMKGANKDVEFSVKNLRILNYNELEDGAGKTDLDVILNGNAFRDSNDGTHFLSIHLGLIEKMLKNSSWLNNQIDLIKPETKGLDKLHEDRVGAFMDMLKEKFTMANSRLFISVHSGRGNFSEELEGPLAEYPFVSLSAIENAFNNSKYLLSQIFYNTVYIGKGVANSKKKNNGNEEDHSNN